MGNQWFKKYILYLAVALLFFVFAIVNTYPLITNISNHQIGVSADGGDGLMFMWDFWWVKTAIFDLRQNPYTTNYLFYPQGTDLYLHTLVPFTSFLSVPLQYIFKNLIFVYNLLVFFYFTLAGFATYLLAKYLTKNNLASIIAGYIFAFSPYMLGHASGHLNLLTSGFIPLFLLYFLQIFENFKKRYVFAAAFFLLLCLVDSLYYGFFMALFAGIYVFYYYLVGGAQRTSKTKWHLLLLLVLFVAVSGPMLNKMVRAQFASDNLLNHNARYWSADIMTFFIPGLSKSAIFFDGTLRDEIMANSHVGAENQNYIGYVVLLLSIIGTLTIFVKKKEQFVFSRKYYVIIFAVIAGISLLFVLGTNLKALGNNYEFPLPYTLIYNFFPLVSVPGRFMLLFYLSAAILAGWGFDYLQSLLAPKKCYYLGGLVLILIAAESIAIPFPVSELKIPSFYQELAMEQDSFAIWDLSSYLDSNSYSAQFINNAAFHMYYQTIHHKKIVDGNISRNNLQTINAAIKGPEINQLENLNIKYVIMPKSKIIFSELEMLKSSLAGYDVVYEDAVLFVYKIF